MSVIIDGIKRLTDSGTCGLKDRANNDTQMNDLFFMHSTKCLLNLVQVYIQ